MNLAYSEELEAHALSVAVRLNGKKPSGKP
jgi:hypothetical protein